MTRSDFDPRDGNGRAAHPSRWLTVIDDEDILLQIEFCRGIAGAHCIFRRRFSSMRKLLWAGPQLRAWLGSIGHRVVYVFVPVENEKLRRFVRLFGFEGSKVRRGHFVMLQEC